MPFPVLAEKDLAGLKHVDYVIVKIPFGMVIALIIETLSVLYSDSM